MKDDLLFKRNSIFIGCITLGYITLCVLGLVDYVT